MVYWSKQWLDTQLPDYELRDTLADYSFWRIMYETQKISLDIVQT